MSIQSQGYSLTLAQGHLDMNVKTFFVVFSLLCFLKKYLGIITKLYRKAFSNKEIKIN